jgi:hypothetical protein
VIESSEIKSKELNLCCGEQFLTAEWPAKMLASKNKYFHSLMSVLFERRQTFRENTKKEKGESTTTTTKPPRIFIYRFFLGLTKLTADKNDFGTEPKMK